MSGLMTHSAGDVIRHALIDLVLGTLPSAGTAWPIHVGNLPNKPDNAILVSDTAGRFGGRVHTSGEMQEHQGVQIKVRSADYQTGGLRARTIAKNLDEDIAQTSVTISGSVYLIEAVTRTSGPLSLGTEEGTERSLFTINAVVSLRQTT